MSKNIFGKNTFFNCNWIFEFPVSIHGEGRVYVILHPATRGDQVRLVKTDKSQTPVFLKYFFKILQLCIAIATFPHCFGHILTSFCQIL